jgi:hypothetical protein
VSLTELIALALLLVGNLLVLRCVISSDMGMSSAVESPALTRARPEPSHLRPAA